MVRVLRVSAWMGVYQRGRWARTDFEHRNGPLVRLIVSDVCNILLTMGAMATASTTVSFEKAAPYDSADAGRRRRDLAELAVGYGLILVVIWTPRPWQRAFYIAAILWIAAAMWVSFDGWKVMGLRFGGMLRSLWVVGVALALAGVALMVASRLGTLNRPPGAGLFVKTFWGYAVWSFVQQLLLQDFVLLRLLRLLPSKSMAIAVATGLFALGHLPSPVLTVMTLVWGGGCLLAFPAVQECLHAGGGACRPGGVRGNYGAGASGPQYACGVGVSAVSSAGFGAWSLEPERP